METVDAVQIRLERHGALPNQRGIISANHIGLAWRWGRPRCDEHVAEFRTHPTATGKWTPLAPPRPRGKPDSARPVSLLDGLVRRGRWRWLVGGWLR